MKFLCQNCGEEFDISVIRSFKFRLKCPNCSWVSSRFLIANTTTLMKIVLLFVFLVVIFWILFLHRTEGVQPYVQSDKLAGYSLLFQFVK